MSFSTLFLIQYRVNDLLNLDLKKNKNNNNNNNIANN